MFSRTRKKRKTNNYNKFIFLILALLLCCIILYCLITFIHSKIILKSNLENDISYIKDDDSSNIFSIDKIILYSSANAISNATSRDLWNLNIYQFTDIAIYINNNSKDGLISSNTIKDLYLDEINYTILPEKGTPSLYYKDIKEFGISNLIDDNKINDSLHFNIINSNETLDTAKPNFYSTCQTPITLQAVNYGIKENAIIPNTGIPLKFDGSLLSHANIPLNNISYIISFNINLINNLDEKFAYKVSIPIPLEDNENSIYNGFIKTELNNFPNSFLRIK